MAFASRRNDAATQALTDTAKGDYTPSTFGPLKYPLDLSTDRDGSNTPDAVCFTIMKRIGVSIDDVTAAAAATLKMGKAALKAGFSDKVGFTVPPSDQTEINKILDSNISDEKKREEVNARMKNLADSKGKELPDTFFELATGSLGKFFTEMGDAKREVAAKKATRKALDVKKGGSDILGSIYMNMPAGVQFADKANWGSQELGVMGQAVKNIVGGGSGVTAGGAVSGMAGNIAAGGVGGIAALAAKMGLKGGLVGMAVGAAGGSVIQKGGEAALGISMNPFLEMMFTGIAFRDMQFDFTMRPRSADEFKVIDEIINMFREHSRPSWSGGALGKHFMNYPMVYNIQFLTTTGTGSAESYVRNTNIPKLKTCVCDSVTTNYSPQNMWTAHKDGVPIAVTLGLHFQETELVMAKDVQGEGY